LKVMEAGEVGEGKRGEKLREVLGVIRGRV
jgi:hypothetical protein